MGGGETERLPSAALYDKLTPLTRRFSRCSFGSF